MAKLQMLSFEDDDIIAQRIKKESNYCDVAHLYVAMFDYEEIDRTVVEIKTGIW